MPFSPFQTPSARRDALSRQIQSAGGVGDARLLAILQGQWVHRYGVATLPTPVMAPASASESESDVFLEPAAVLAIDPPTDPVPPIDPAPPIEQDALNDQQQNAASNPSSTRLLRETLADEISLQGEQPYKAIPEPPLNTPRSLRRWLPDVEETFPKAS